MVRDSGFLYVEDINITNSLRVKDRRQRKEAASGTHIRPATAIGRILAPSKLTYGISSLLRIYRM